MRPLDGIGHKLPASSKLFYLLRMHVSRGLELKDTTVQPTEQILFKVVLCPGLSKENSKDLFNLDLEDKNLGLA